MPRPAQTSCSMPCAQEERLHKELDEEGVAALQVCPKMMAYVRGTDQEETGIAEA